MSFLNGITALLLFQLVGEVGVHTLSLPIPGPVLGMFLLFVFLLTRGSLSSGLDAAASGLLRHLALLFVPAGVGVHLETLSGEWMSIVIALVLSTFLTMAATALIMRVTIHLFARSSDGH